MSLPYPSLRRRLLVQNLAKQVFKKSDGDKSNFAPASSLDPGTVNAASSRGSISSRLSSRVRRLLPGRRSKAAEEEWEYSPSYPPPGGFEGTPAMSMPIHYTMEVIKEYDSSASDENRESSPRSEPHAEFSSSNSLYPSNASNASSSSVSLGGASSLSSDSSSEWPLAKDHTFYLARLSEGGFGKVFLLEPDMRVALSGQPMVMKVVKVQKDSIFSHRMEIEALRRIWEKPHPNVLDPPGVYKGVDDIWWSRKDVTLSMLFRYYPIDLRQLAEYCRSYSFASSKSFTQKVISDVTKGLVHLHNLGIIHKDIKPGNIFIDEAGDCKIADFGGAFVLVNGKRLEGAIATTEVGQITKEYCAPELQMSTIWTKDVEISCFNESCDFWSLGMCIFVLLTGDVYEIKYDHREGLGWRISEHQVNFQQDMHRIVQELAIPCDEGVREFFFKCCQIDPKDRVRGREALRTVNQWTIDHSVLRSVLCSSRDVCRRKIAGPLTRIADTPRFGKRVDAEAQDELRRQFENHLEVTSVYVPEHSGFKFDYIS